MIVQVEYLSDGRNCHQHKLQQVKTACPASLVHGIIRPPVQVADGHNQYVGTVGVPNAASKCITCIRTCMKVVHTGKGHKESAVKGDKAIKL